MVITFDPPKSERNRRERGLPFEMADEIDWMTAYIVEDARKDYGELRFQAFGLIKGRLHIVVFTPRDEDIHVISLRKANRKEERIYEREAQRSSRTPG